MYDRKQREALPSSSPHPRECSVEEMLHTGLCYYSLKARDPLLIMEGPDELVTGIIPTYLRYSKLLGLWCSDFSQLVIHKHPKWEFCFSESSKQAPQALDVSENP